MKYLDLGDGKIPLFRKGFITYKVPRFIHGNFDDLPVSALYKARRVVSTNGPVIVWDKHKHRKIFWPLSNGDMEEFLFWKLQSVLFTELEPINAN